MLTLEERKVVSELNGWEQRRRLDPLKLQCEVCGIQRALQVIRSSLVLCCRNRADMCGATEPPIGTKCFGCGADVTKKTRSGWVCGSHCKWGCNEVAKALMLRKSETSHELMADPEYRAAHNQKYKATMTERYGADSVMSIPEKRAKHEAACLKRYGTKNAASSEEIKERTRQSNRKRFGVDYQVQLEGQRARLIKANERVWGVQSCVSSPEWRREYKERTGEDHPMKLEEHREAQRTSWVNKYGSHPWANTEVRTRLVATCLARYDVTNGAGAMIHLQARLTRNLVKYGVAMPTGLPEVVAAREASNLKKYGVRYPIQDPVIFRTKYLRGFFRSKPFDLPSGKQIYYQGYELPVIQRCLNLYGEGDLLFNGEIHFDYNDPLTGKMRRYFPDLTVKSVRQTIEVKSEYTLMVGLKTDLIPKLSAAIREGWTPVVEVRSTTALRRSLSYEEILTLVRA